jgi:tRNA(fMet)-specific endonuclease VapC
MKYLLDSNAVSVWAKRSSTIFLSHLIKISPKDLCISSVVEMEVLFGIELKPQFSYLPALKSLLRELPVVNFDSASAVEAAKIRAHLQRIGRPIGGYDALIAASALAHGLIVVTHNTREFSRVDGLLVEDWQTG